MERSSLLRRDDLCDGELFHSKQRNIESSVPQKGSKKAIKAVARRLAVIFYTLVKNQTPYDPKIVVMDEEKRKARKIARLRKEAEKIGCKLEVLAA